MSLDGQTAQSRGCGKALLKWHGAEVSASLFLHPHPWESGMLARVLCLNSGAFLVMQCFVSLQYKCRMGKLYILPTATWEDQSSKKPPKVTWKHIWKIQKTDKICFSSVCLLFGFWLFSFLISP